jgi:hypothetical protein
MSTEGSELGDTSALVAHQFDAQVSAVDEALNFS